MNLMKDYQDVLNSFPPEREEKLREVERYSMFDIFFYRPTLWHHVLRVFLIVQELTPLVKNALPHCDTEKAKVLALVHDDAEILTGDVQLGHKQKMTEEELKAIDDEEAAAIEELAEKFPNEIRGYNYRELLQHALYKDCIEAILVSYADKLDAYCESLHEVFGGNITALRAVQNYTHILHALDKKYADLKPLFEYRSSPFLYTELFRDQWHVHKENYAHLNTPHTKQSVLRDTDYQAYNLWKKLVLKHLGEEGMDILTTQKEFH
jgi:5'-deoxynucleotidase YfbR-like HD superfamily hydrolase